MPLHFLSVKYYTEKLVFCGFNVCEPLPMRAPRQQKLHIKDRAMSIFITFVLHLLQFNTKLCLCQCLSLYCRRLIFQNFEVEINWQLRLSVEQILHCKESLGGHQKHYYIPPWMQCATLS